MQIVTTHSLTVSQVQDVAERERRYFSLALSSAFALLLWFAGAAIFQRTEYLQGWTYFEALYFAYAALLTIGYGDYAPHSNAGKAFFVLWSLLAVPSLTILISNMGDTIVKWFSDFTVALGAITVLPEEQGFRDSLRRFLGEFTGLTRNSFANLTLPGVLGAAPRQHENRISSSDYRDRLLDRLAGRLSAHLGKDQESSAPQDVNLDQDIAFYHYVLSRECRNLQKDSHKSPPKQYKWEEWEYYLKLMGDNDDTEEFPGQTHPNRMVPKALQVPKKVDLHANADGDHASEHHEAERPDSEPHNSSDARHSSHAALLDSEKGSPSSQEGREESGGPYAGAPLDGNIDRQTSLLQKAHPKPRRRRHPDDESEFLQDWSWLSNESPLMSTKSEPEWILERLSAALERELNRTRKGYKRRPPVGLRDAYRQSSRQSAVEKQGLGRAAEGAD